MPFSFPETDSSQCRESADESAREGMDAECVHTIGCHLVGALLLILSATLPFAATAQQDQLAARMRYPFACVESGTTVYRTTPCPPSRPAPEQPVRRCVSDRGETLHQRFDCPPGYQERELRSSTRTASTTSSTPSPTILASSPQSRPDLSPRTAPSRSDRVAIAQGAVIGADSRRRCDQAREERDRVLAAPGYRTLDDHRDWNDRVRDACR